MPAPSFCKPRWRFTMTTRSRSLSARILAEEHRIYTEAVRIVLEGRFRIEGRRVLIAPEKN